MPRPPREHRPPRRRVGGLCKVRLARCHVDADEAALAPDGLEQRRAVCAPLRRVVETAEDLAQQHAQLLLALVS